MRNSIKLKKRKNFKEFFCWVNFRSRLASGSWGRRSSFRCCTSIWRTSFIRTTSLFRRWGFCHFTSFPHGCSLEKEWDINSNRVVKISQLIFKTIFTAMFMWNWTRACSYDMEKGHVYVIKFHFSRGPG